MALIRLNSRRRRRRRADLNSVFTLILIFYLAHVLTCAWYYVGSQDSDGEGWADSNYAGMNLTDASVSDKVSS